MSTVFCHIQTSVSDSQLILIIFCQRILHRSSETSVTNEHFTGFRHQSCIFEIFIIFYFESIHTFLIIEVHVATFHGFQQETSTATATSICQLGIALRMNSHESHLVELFFTCDTESVQCCFIIGIFSIQCAPV